MSSYSNGTRLPGTQSAGRSTRLLQGVLAIVGVLLVVVGLPLFLLSAFGTPWPDTTPSVEWLTRPVTADTVLGVLAAVVWLAWAHFLVCLAVETVAEIRHRGVAPRVPGGGIGTQQLARRLVTAILLLAGTAGMGVAPALAASAPTAPQQTTSVVAAPTVAQVLGIDAVRETAHATTARESQSATTHSGAHEARLPAVDTLERATRTDVRDGVTTYYDVKPPRGRHYDTLWDMAERYLGDGLRYKEIWELNKDVVQPDGRVLKNADLIYPGWVMKLPSDAKGPGLKVVDHATLLSPATTAAPRSSDTLTAPRTEAASAGVTHEEAGDHSLVDEQLAPWLGVTGGLAFAGVALALRRRRTASSFGQLWAARLRTVPGRGPDGGPDGPTGGHAVALESGADVSTASWLAAGLRAWNHTGPVPAPSAVTVAGSGAAFAFEDEPTSAVPPGWEARGPKVWVLGRDATSRPDGLSPLPGLVSIGRRADGSVAMVDPESVPGLVALEGDATQARGLALSIAVDTATHAWADKRQVTLVGFADDVSTISPETLRHTHDMGRVLESLENLATYQRAACRRAGADSVGAARITAPDTAAWVYHLVVCSGVPAPEDLQRLTSLAADPHVALGVVVVGAVPESGMRLSLRDDGRLVAPVQGLDLTPQVLDVEAARALTAVCELPDEVGDVTLDQVATTLEKESAARLVDDALIRVSILGPVQIEAPGAVEEERRELLTELACLLALHPDGLHVNRVSAAIWPRGVDSDVLAATMSQLSAWFGADPDGAPVLREESGVWSVAPGALSLDWAWFRGALNRSARQDAERESQLRLALDLVRGPAFAGVADRRYAWLAATGVVEDTTLAVGLTATALADLAAERGDAEGAVSAVERGLELLPANEDLWCSRLLLARRFGSRSDVEDVAARMYEALDEHGSAIGATARTDSLVSDLLPGWTRRVA
jgi:DNA-binding SARP family transcriptional activator